MREPFGIIFVCGVPVVSIFEWYRWYRKSSGRALTAGLAVFVGVSVCLSAILVGALESTVLAKWVVEPRLMGALSGLFGISLGVTVVVWVACIAVSLLLAKGLALSWVSLVFCFGGAIVHQAINLKTNAMGHVLSASLLLLYFGALSYALAHRRKHVVPAGAETQPRAAEVNVRRR